MAPTVNINDLVEQMSGDGIASYSSAAMPASVPGVLPGLSLPPMTSGPCLYSAADQRFDCAPLAVNGMTVTRSYALLDANGQSLSTLDVSLIASIRTITDVTGTASTAGSALQSMTINRHEDATLSDLHTPKHILNGTSTQQMDFVLSGTTFSTSETSATSNLRLPSPYAYPPFPLGGTITSDRTVSSSQFGPVTSHEVLTFDGTSVMTLTMTGARTVTCKIDLANPGAIPVCH
jgi:hypothetical protein